MSGSPEDLEIVCLSAEVEHLRQRADRAERILAALRNPSETVLMGAHQQLRGVFRRRRARGYLVPVICAAVAAAEQEVGG